MVKPDDIPQDVWAIAGGVYSDLETVARDEWTVRGDPRDQAIFARAIMAAKAEAFEIAAKLVDEAEKDDFDSAMAGLADAIRKRSEA